MLGTTISQPIKPGQIQTLFAPPVATTTTPTPTNTTAPWVPWAIGAVIGGGVLFLLLRD